MPSPEVINLTLSNDEIQPDPIRSDQGTSMPTRATNQFRTSSSTPPTSGINRTQRIIPVIQGTFAAIERAENYLPLQPFFNNTHFGQTLINSASTTNTGLAYLTSILWRPASTHTLKWICHKRVCED